MTVFKTKHALAGIAVWSLFTLPIFAVSSVLTPGSGFSGPTSQPAAIGSGRGADAKAIARWDVVPYQTFDGDYNVGVVAFHINGIDRVEFSVNGGPWLSVNNMTPNPQTANHSDIGVSTNGIAEYWATLHAADFPDGLIEIRSIAFPKVGIPRLLEPLWLNANANHSLREEIRFVDATNGNDGWDGLTRTFQGNTSGPKATIVAAMQSLRDANGRVDGGRIALLPGEHQFGPGVWPHSQTWERWLTIEPAAGVNREDAILATQGTAGLISQLVHLRNLTVHTALPTPNRADGPLGSNTVLPRIWLDTCAMESTDNGVNVNWTQNWGFTYETDCVSRNTLRGPTNVALARNCRFENLGSDALEGAQYVIRQNPLIPTRFSGPGHLRTSLCMD